jgi:hypothetical protein
MHLNFNRTGNAHVELTLAWHGMAGTPLGIQSGKWHHTPMLCCAERISAPPAGLYLEVVGKHFHFLASFPQVWPCCKPTNLQ